MANVLTSWFSRRSGVQYRLGVSFVVSGFSPIMPRQALSTALTSPPNTFPSVLPVGVTPEAAPLAQTYWSGRPLLPPGGVTPPWPNGPRPRAEHELGPPRRALLPRGLETLCWYEQCGNLFQGPLHTGDTDSCDEITCRGPPRRRTGQECPVLSRARRGLSLNCGATALLQAYYNSSLLPAVPAMPVAGLGAVCGRRACGRGVQGTQSKRY
jgi:hypothetical protein